jgi:hypothetical protein
MRFPASNVVTPLIESRWNGLWDTAPLVSDPQKFGFADFTMEEVFPLSKLISTEFELSWDAFSSWTTVFRSTWYTCVAVSALYLVAIPVGQRLMANLPAFELKYPLFLWNLALAIFSIMGMLHVVPSFLYGMLTNGPMYYICRNASVGYGRGPLGLWCVLFVLSKYAELIDTAFLVLRKKPVPFLHWFHHASVLLISVGTIMLFGPSGIIMIAMNFFVHSIMYSYYAIAAVTRPPKWGKMVTTLQIAQMVGGLIMVGGIYFGARNIENCEVQPTNAFGILFIYTSYLVLFVRFYINRYLVKRPVRENLKKAE